MAQQRRHFLRGRWLDPAETEDEDVVNALLSQMTTEQSAAATDLLVDFSRWKPGPAGRGGERVCRKRSGSPGDSYDEDSDVEQTPQGGSKRRAVHSESGQTHTHKRVSAGGYKRESGGGGCQGRGMLELLCMVASSVEEKNALSAIGSESEDSSSDGCVSSARTTVHEAESSASEDPQGVESSGENCGYVAQDDKSVPTGRSDAASTRIPAVVGRADVPAPFATLFKSETTSSVVDEGMSRYPIGGYATALAGMAGIVCAGQSREGTA